MPPDLKGFIPDYHRRQYLPLPVAFKNGSRELFVLRTAMPYTAMTAEATSLASDLKLDFMVACSQLGIAV